MRKRLRAHHVPVGGVAAAKAVEVVSVPEVEVEGVSVPLNEVEVKVCLEVLCELGDAVPTDRIKFA